MWQNLAVADDAAEHALATHRTYNLQLVALSRFS